MMPTFLSLSLALVLAAEPETPRKMNPLAPSLPLLTDKEEEAIDKSVDAFIEYDLGKLGGEEGKKALKEFQALGPEATFALVRGLNKSAGIEATCPAATIGKKLVAIIKTTRDPDLLDYIRENVGAGITKSPHMGIIKDVRLAAQLRKKECPTRIVLKPDPKPDNPLAKLSTKDLASKAGSERGDKLKALLTEVETRTGELALATLGEHASHYETDVAAHARAMLLKHLSRQPMATVKDGLRSDRAEVRQTAAQVVGDKGHKLAAELIDLLNDREEDVRQAARQSLKKLAKGTDHGPERGAKEADRAEAMKQWRAWLAKQGK